ncbi:sucrose-6F-phosphate phosphohydrolase [Psychromonas ingrahamii 37]|uniref:Sucrose-6F-phosphate phosphohydrolase n=1 Tax=Psychromonas ingrahamii (strain DSM 17664 / CCUG 51855 / 37) TaxID=357804 RepID=A1SUD3_PSYIN|nr:HAD family hydrolase [Psychromonas ingrahamii]ABM03098.1 sucrose-6F-phosphate phosphohydrolase [Psychromonas ingrahamii 37]
MTQSSRIFVFTDLDDSLFSSKRKHTKTADSQITSVNKQGEIESYATLQQQKLVQMLAALKASFIAVTGRRTSAYKHCIIDQVTNSEYAIVSHGALILDKKSALLPCWINYLNNTYDMKHWQKKLTQAHCQLINYFSAMNCEARVRLIIDHDICTYICIKIPAHQHQESLLAKINLHLKQLDFSIHGNAGNFAVLPPYASKELAVNYLIKKLNISDKDVVFGIGDSVSDLPFIRNLDFAIFPKSSQIMKAISHV